MQQQAEEIRGLALFLAGLVVQAFSPSTLAEDLADRSLVEEGLVYTEPGQPGLHIMYIAACL